jgi:ATP sulfurylase
VISNIFFQAKLYVETRKYLFKDWLKDLYVEQTNLRIFKYLERKKTIANAHTANKESKKKEELIAKHTTRGVA